jgi:hypothetical protein
MKRTPLRRISDRRLVETNLYRYRIKQFLLEHPYCQVWLAEHGISEETALREGGVVPLPNGSRASVPLATQVHHRNKRRGADLLDQDNWLAVSAEAHDRIESDKAWARAQGFLLPF